jgi:hypothetical protein
VHDSIILSESWRRRLAHLHYRALPTLGKMVTSLPKLCIEHDGIRRGCALGMNAKGSFPSSEAPTHPQMSRQLTFEFCAKPLSGTSLAGMQMFPWGSVDDCNIVLIFQD